MKTHPIVIGSDHAGYELKRRLSRSIRSEGFQLIDVGTDSQRPVDYPDFAEAVALSVTELLSKGHEAAKGILICGSGVGASIAANKIPGVRAGLCHDSYSAHQGVEHDDMNVLVLGARVIGAELAEDLSEIFLNARFDRVARHARRVRKIHELESKYFSCDFQATIPRRSA